MTGSRTPIRTLIARASTYRCLANPMLSPLPEPGPEPSRCRLIFPAHARLIPNPSRNRMRTQTTAQGARPLARPGGSRWTVE